MARGGFRSSARATGCFSASFTLSVATRSTSSPLAASHGGASGMADKRITAAELRARSTGHVDRDKIVATTEGHFGQQIVEDGEDLLQIREDWYPAPVAVRHRLGMTQEQIAAGLRVPVSTWRNWEQGRVQVDPIVRSFLIMLWRIPQTAMQSLTRCPTCSSVDAVSEPSASTGHLIHCPKCGSLHEDVSQNGIRAVRLARISDRRQPA